MLRDKDHGLSLSAGLVGTPRRLDRSGVVSPCAITACRAPAPTSAKPSLGSRVGFKLRVRFSLSFLIGVPKPMGTCPDGGWEPNNDVMRSCPDGDTTQTPRGPAPSCAMGQVCFTVKFLMVVCSSKSYVMLFTLYIHIYIHTYMYICVYTYTPFF